jgi:hypothetical protein
MQLKVFTLLTLVLSGLLSCHPARKAMGPPGQSTTEGRFSQAGLPASAPAQGSQKQPEAGKTDSFLVLLLRQHPEYFDKILRGRDSLHVQIIYTQIDRDAANAPSFRNYYFHVNPDSYFYPASTVKLPTALLALQKLNELRLPGLNKYSTLITEKGYSGQTAVYNDPSTPNGRPTLAQYIRKIFLVSDNDAFNRLYEFLGNEYINGQLHKMGYKDAAIVHRLSISLTEQENRRTNPVSFYDSTGRLLYTQPLQLSRLPYPERHDSAGSAWYNGSLLIPHPMDFSKKNRISLEDLHNILRSVLFPESVPAVQRFNLTEADLQFVWQYLSELPPESLSPSYDGSVYFDAFGKLLYLGAEKGRMPRNIRIFSKEGDAYGFLTDISYFTDFDKRIEFMLSATIYCNSDGIINDDKYDYSTIGLPFLKQLGQVIYQYELQRSRSHLPDLSPFRLIYH